MSRLLSLFFTFLFLLFAASCQEKEEAVDRQEEISRIENVLEKYVIANENQDFHLIEQIWAEDESIILIGTDSDEQFKGWEQIRAAIQHQFAEFEDTYISVIDQQIRLSADGKTAWFSEFINYNFIHNGSAKSFEGIRYTGVLVKNEGRWELVQSHLSIPVDEGTELGKE